jgi:hypothetical protein
VTLTAVAQPPLLPGCPTSTRSPVTEVARRSPRANVPSDLLRRLLVLHSWALILEPGSAHPPILSARRCGQPHPCSPTRRHPRTHPVPHPNPDGFTHDLPHIFRRFHCFQVCGRTGQRQLGPRPLHGWFTHRCPPQVPVGLSGVQKLPRRYGGLLTRGMKHRASIVSVASGAAPLTGLDNSYPSGSGLIVHQRAAPPGSVALAILPALPMVSSVQQSRTKAILPRLMSRATLASSAHPRSNVCPHRLWRRHPWHQ